jgi:hypothetical protein
MRGGHAGSVHALVAISQTEWPGRSSKVSGTTCEAGGTVPVYGLVKLENNNDTVPSPEPGTFDSIFPT